MVLASASPFMTVQLPDEEYADPDEEEYHPDFVEPEQDLTDLESLNQQSSLDNFPLQPSVSGPGDIPSEDVTQPQRPLPKHAILQVYPNRLKDVPPHTSGGQVFSIDEKVDFDSGGEV